MPLSIKAIEEVFKSDLNQPMFITSEGYNELLATIKGTDVSKLVTSSEEQLLEKECFTSYFDIESKAVSDDKPKGRYITVIRISGPLFSKPNMFTKWYGFLSYPQISGMFNEALGDAKSEGILFDIESPGGSANGMLDLSDEIYAGRGVKPIIALSHDYAFSAAYGIASAADKIYMTRDAMVGSVGVIMQHVEYSEYLKKEGIKVTAIFAGERKNDFSPYEKLKAEAKASAQEMVDDLYDQFTSTVSRNRGITQAKVKKTEAGVFVTKKALQVGFADEEVSYEDSVSKMLEATGEITGTTASSLITSETINADSEEKPESELTENKTNIDKEVNENMDLNELKTKHPDLYKSVVASVTKEVEAKSKVQISGLTEQITTLETTNASQEDRILKIEKSNTIRDHNDIDSSAEGIWDKALADSAIPEDMHSKVRPMVTHAKFTKEGVFDKQGFTEAVNAEVKDWEAKFANSSVMGFSSTAKTETDLANAVEEKAENENLADNMLSLGGQPQDKK